MLQYPTDQIMDESTRPPTAPFEVVALTWQRARPLGNGSALHARASGSLEWTATQWGAADLSLIEDGAMAIQKGPGGSLRPISSDR